MNEQQKQALSDKCQAALNKVCKWRMIITGKWIGTRRIEDPEGQSIRDFSDKLILLRVEQSALIGLLLRKRIFSLAELQKQLIEEAEALDKAYEKSFPGMHSTDEGIEIYAPQIAADTMRGWPK